MSPKVCGPNSLRNRHADNEAGASLRAKPAGESSLNHVVSLQRVLARKLRLRSASSLKRHRPWSMTHVSSAMTHEHGSFGMSHRSRLSLHAAKMLRPKEKRCRCLALSTQARICHATHLGHGRDVPNATDLSPDIRPQPFCSIFCAIYRNWQTATYLQHLRHVRGISAAWLWELAEKPQRHVEMKVPRECGNE